MPSRRQGRGTSPPEAAGPWRSWACGRVPPSSVSAGLSVCLPPESFGAWRAQPHEVTPLESHQPGTHRTAAGVAAASGDRAVTHCGRGQPLGPPARRGAGVGFQARAARSSRALRLQARPGGGHSRHFLRPLPWGGLRGERACARLAAWDTGTPPHRVSAPRRGVSAQGPAPSAGPPLGFDCSCPWACGGALCSHPARLTTSAVQLLGAFLPTVPPSVQKCLGPFLFGLFVFLV